MRAERAGEGALHRPCLAQRCEQGQCVREDKNTAQPTMAAACTVSVVRSRNLAYRLIVTCSSCSSGPLSRLSRGWPARW
jgi:hypothetical protein